jgi:hypothetical protein
MNNRINLYKKEIENEVINEDIIIENQKINNISFTDLLDKLNVFEIAFGTAIALEFKDFVIDISENVIYPYFVKDNNQNFTKKHQKYFDVFLFLF